MRPPLTSLNCLRFVTPPTQALKSLCQKATNLETRARVDLRAPELQKLSPQTRKARTAKQPKTKSAKANNHKQKQETPNTKSHEPRTLQATAETTNMRINTPETPKPTTCKPEILRTPKPNRQNTNTLKQKQPNRNNNLREFVLTTVILAPSACGREGASRGSCHLIRGIRQIRWTRQIRV